MEKNKRPLQFIFGILFVLGIIAFGLYVVGQLQLNKDSKVIIDSNNGKIDSYSNEFKESVKAFENLDSIKLETEVQTSLLEKLSGHEVQIENLKNQLKPGVNSPSSNNYKLALSKLDSYKKSSQDLKEILNTKICIKNNYGEYLVSLNKIAEAQDLVSRATSLEGSKTSITSLESAYLDLTIKAEEVKKCFELEELADLKKSIIEAIDKDKLTIELYKTTYLDPLMALYLTEDYTKIGEFIDLNATLSVKLELPSLFDNSLELSIADKIIEEMVSSITSRI